MQESSTGGGVCMVKKEKMWGMVGCVGVGCAILMTWNKYKVSMKFA